MHHDAMVRRASIFALVVAGAVLLGWTLDISILRSGAPGLIAMNPTSALAFILTAGALLVLRAKPSEQPSSHRWGAKLAAAIITATGALTVAGYFLDHNFGLDQILFGGQLAGNRIPSNTGINLVLIGLSLLLLDAKSRRAMRASQLFAATSGLTALIAVTGYLFSADRLYAFVHNVPLALNTAIVVATLNVGILLARPNRGLMALVTGDGPGAAAARRLLPAAFAVPVGVGLLRLMGQRAGLYGTELGVAMFVLTIALMFAAAVLAFAAWLERAEADRRRGEEARARLAAIVESSDDAVVANALDGTITSWNPGAERLYGYSAAEAVGQPIALLLPTERADEAVDLLARVAAGEPVKHFETTRLTKGGRLVDVSLSTSPIANSSGRVVGASSIARDVSERKRAEEALAHTLRELEQRTRALEAKTREQETFVHTVSHDLRAPLVSLQGMVSILLEDHGAELSSNARRYLDRIVANADKMQGLISDLMELSRVGRLDLDQGPVDLGSVVGDVTEQLGHTLAARGAVVRLENELPTVWANRARMTQLFANLIGNAVAYTPADRLPVVRLGAIGRPDCWELTVSDNGVGIPDAWKEKIFGLFQRLPAGKSLNPAGSGVGLAIVARVVETHDGRLWLESTEGIGTTFHITLPKREDMVLNPVHGNSMGANGAPLMLAGSGATN